MMTTATRRPELSDLVQLAEQSVATVQDEALKRIAFEKVLQSLLAEQTGGTPQVTAGAPHVNVEASPEKKSTVARSAYKPTHSPSIVRGLNLRPANAQSLREFFAEKQPKTNQEIGTVIVYYLQHKLTVSGITPNHIYTGYKEVGAKMPTALVQLIRDISCRKGWINSSNIADLQTEIHGENLVEHDLPRSPKPR